MLTLQKLKDMEPGEIIATGVTKDDRLYAKAELRWVAVRGGIWDWALYYHFATHGVEYVKTSGDKSFTEAVIRELVPCDDEAWDMYRT
jgi:hypothetical protein